jgi:hypothetical protein
MLSASGSARWLECTPSAHFELQFPKKTSAYADEGTAAHELCELAARYWLKEISEMDYENKRDELAKGQYYNAEMQECANDYAMFINDTYKSAKQNCSYAIVELEVEGLDFSKWAPEGFGTGDCIIIADDVLEIIDFKYGKGVRVEAENNPQMRLYALGALQQYGDIYDIRRVRMSIIQPRINNQPSTDEISVEELMDWAETYVKPRAALAFAGEGEFSPSEDTCKFCRAKEQCKARADVNLALFDDAPDSLLLTVEEAGQILAKAADIKAWLKDLENLVMQSLFDGTPVEGWKIVEGRSNRKYADEDKVAKAMLKAGYNDAVIYERSLITLTAMEKAFGKKKVGEILSDLIVKPPGKPKLVESSDKRPEFKPEKLILDAFDEDEE